MKKAKLTRTDIKVLASTALFVILLIFIFGTAGLIETEVRPAPQVFIRFFIFIILFGINALWIIKLNRRERDEIRMQNMQERMDQRCGQSGKAV